MNMEELRKMDLAGTMIVAGSDNMERSVAGLIDRTSHPCGVGIEIQWHFWWDDQERRTEWFMDSCWQCRIAGSWIILDRIAPDPAAQINAPYRDVNQYAILRKADK